MSECSHPAVHLLGQLLHAWRHRWLNVCVSSSLAGGGDWSAGGQQNKINQSEAQLMEWQT
jgi:hypothetical protein